MQFSRAFTMIELIFVIVIIGILSVVAIPKLNATRDDAKVARMAMNIMTGVSEISSYAVAQGSVEDNLSAMSNGIALLVKTGDANLSTKKAVIKMGNIPNCLTLEIQSDTAGDDNLSLTTGNANGDRLCTSLQSAIDTANFNIKLRGVNVTY